LRIGGLDETGAVAAGNICQESELGDEKEFAFGGADIQIHFVVFVGKNPQLNELGRNFIKVGLSIIAANSEKNNHSRPDTVFPFRFGFDDNGSLADSLDQSNHERTIAPRTKVAILKISILSV